MEVKIEKNKNLVRMSSLAPGQAFISPKMPDYPFIYVGPSMELFNPDDQEETPCILSLSVTDRGLESYAWADGDEMVEPVRIKSMTFG